MRTTWMILLLASLSLSAVAEEQAPLPAETQTLSTEIIKAPDPQAETPPPSWWEETLRSLERGRHLTTRKYLSMSRSIDQYFYGEALENSRNKSYLKMELNNTNYEGGEMEQDVKLRGKLDLPNTKKHLKLVFTSSADLEKPLEERVTDEASGERVKKDDSFAGLEYTPDKPSAEWERKFTGGIKLRTPLLPFAKYDLENTWQLTKQWSSNFEQVFWYLDDDGFGETSQVSFNRPLGDTHQLQISSELEFRDEENTFSYDLISSVTKRLTPRSSLEYYAGGFGESQPTNQITSYILGTTYRKQLYQDWLFFDVEPSISFPRDDNWKPAAAMTVRLQIFFQDR